MTQKKTGPLYRDRLYILPENYYIKSPPPSGLAASSFEVAIAHEFKTLASLRHPHIISVLDYGFARDDAGETSPFFTMEFLQNSLTLLTACELVTVEKRIELLIKNASNDQLQYIQYCYHYRIIRELCLTRRLIRRKEH